MPNKKPVVNSAKPVQQKKERILEGAINIAQSEMDLNFEQAISDFKRKKEELTKAEQNLGRLEKLYGIDNFKEFAEKFKL